MLSLSLTLIYAMFQACSDLCRGEYTPQSDNIKSLFSCSAYTAPTLACIAVGVGELTILFPVTDHSISASLEWADKDNKRYCDLSPQVWTLRAHPLPNTPALLRLPLWPPHPLGTFLALRRAISKSIQYFCIKTKNKKYWPTNAFCY